MASISSLGIGSGLDLNGLLDQLESAERKQLEPIMAQQMSYEAKISAYGTLQGAMTKFQDAAAKLNDPELYASLSASSQGDGVGTTITTGAQPGNFSVHVDSLARAQSMTTGGFASREDELGSGTLSFTVGGDNVAVDIAQEDSSLEGIRDAINASDAGVSASIVNTGSGDTPYQLVLTSKETGTQSTLTGMSFSATGDDKTLETQLDFTAMSQTVAAQDASLTVNGIAITSQSNEVKGAIEGVTLSLTETHTEDEFATVKVEHNNLALREAVQGFVESYNDLKGTMGDLSSFNAEADTAGELLGDSTLRSVESRLRSALTSGVAEGAFSTLSDIGISLQLDGTLELDNDRLDDIISTQRGELQSFFAGSEGDSTTERPGLADALGDSLASMLDDGGLLDNATSGLETRMEGLVDRYASTERSIDATVERYRAQFGQLDTLIANMNQTSSYLTQQFDALNALNSQ